MSEIITLSVNLSKLDKGKFIKGKQGTYCDLVLIPTPNSEYGTHMVKQNATKEERDKRVQLPILGNAKTRGTKQNGGQRASTSDNDNPDIDW